MLMYFSLELKSSITEFNRIFDNDVLNYSHLIAYVRAKTTAIMYRSGIWSLSLLNFIMKLRSDSFFP